MHECCFMYVHKGRFHQMKFGVGEGNNTMHMQYFHLSLATSQPSWVGSITTKGVHVRQVISLNYE